MLIPVTTRLRLTTPFPRPVLRTKDTVHLPTNKVTPSYSTSHIPSTAHVHLHIVCFALFDIVVFICHFCCI